MALMALGYAQFGALLRFELQRAGIQRAIKLRLKQGVPEEELTTFTLTAEQWRALRWVKPGREFRLPDGRMFDVGRRAEGPAGTVVLHCIADHQETALFAGLKEAVARDLEGRVPEAKDRVQQLLRSLCSGSAEKWLRPPPPLIGTIPSMEERTRWLRSAPGVPPPRA